MNSLKGELPQLQEKDQDSIDSFFHELTSLEKDNENYLHKLNTLIEHCQSNQNKNYLKKSYELLSSYHADKKDYSQTFEAVNKTIDVSLLMDENDSAFDFCERYSKFFYNSAKYKYSYELEKKAKIIADTNFDIKKSVLAESNMAQPLSRMGRIDDALKIDLKVLKHWIKFKDLFRIANTQNNIGGIYLKRGEKELALKYLMKSYYLFQKIGDDKSMSFTLNNIAIVYKKLNDFNKALLFFEKSMKIKTELGNEAGIATVLNNMGTIHHEKGDSNTAMNYYQKALIINRKINNQTQISQNLNNIGNINLEFDNFHIALESFNESLKIRREMNDLWGQTIALTNIAEVYKEITVYDKALDYIHQSYEISKKEQFQEYILTNLRLLSEIYEAQEENKKSLHYLKKYIDLKEKISRKEHEDLIVEMETRCEIVTKKKEAEIFKLRNIELKSAVDKLEKSFQKLKESQSEIINLEKKNSVLAMAATANHEIKQPLTILKGNLEIFSNSLKPGCLNEKQVEKINKMEKSINKISSILNKYKTNTEFWLENYSEKTKMVVFKDKVK